MRRLTTTAAAVLLATAAACGGGGPAETDSIRLYTSVTQETVDAVLAGYQRQHPQVTVEVFRAPTGELSARLAAEQREGGVQADLLWLTDPLSMQQYDAEGLLEAWTPAEAAAIPAHYRTDTFWGTRLLNLVIVASDRLDPVTATWHDLTGEALRDRVAIPNPAFAGSAFGALAFFALTDGFGFDYYRALAANGAVQVQTPGEVLTGVAEGQFLAGITLEQAAREAVDKGSPVVMVWPQPGAIAIYSPIAVVTGRPAAATAHGFTNYLLSRPGQEAVASVGFEPVRNDVDWPFDGPQLDVDWADAFDRQQELLEAYRAIFGG